MYQRNFKSNIIFIDDIAYLDDSNTKHAVDRKSNIFVKKLLPPEIELLIKIIYVRVRSYINKTM